MESITATDARNRFADLIKDAQREVVQITQHNKPAAAVLSWEIYESLIETLEVLSDEDLMEKIRRGEADIREGRSYEWEEVKRELAL